MTKVNSEMTERREIVAQVRNVGKVEVNDRVGQTSVTRTPPSATDE